MKRLTTLFVMLLALPAFAQVSHDDGTCSAEVGDRTAEWSCTLVPEPEPACFDGCSADSGGVYDCGYFNRQPAACLDGYTESRPGWRWTYTPVAPEPEPEPEPEPSSTLSVSVLPSTMAAGGTATFSWEYTGQDACTASALGQSQAVAAVGSVSYALPSTTTLTVTCGDLSDSATVTVTSDPGPDPDPEPDPDPPPPSTASCDSLYRGIPDPCAAIGYDVFADYTPDEVITGTHGSRNLSGQGTAADPYVIDASGATFSKVNLSGSYVILQGGKVNAPAGRGYWFSSSSCTRCVIRDVEVEGPGVDSSHSSAAGLGNFNVWLRGSIHGFGDNRQEAPEQDFHAIKTTSGSDIWILDAELYDNSGDSVQVGDASRGSASRVYIGGGYMHHNRENAIDIKDSRDIVVSGVRMETFSGSSSDPGAAVVIHDDAYDARIYDNIVRDARFGMVVSGVSGHILDGNDIQAHSKGLELRNTSNLTVTNNTISAPIPVDCQSGLSGNIQGC